MRGFGFSANHSDVTDGDLRLPPCVFVDSADDVRPDPLYVGQALRFRSGFAYLQPSSRGGLPDPWAKSNTVPRD